jgi:hypothetical protein
MHILLIFAIFDKQVKGNLTEIAQENLNPCFIFLLAVPVKIQIKLQ